MLAISRQNLIKELLQENKSVTIADLAVRMNVTRETIRRDLEKLDESVRGELNIRLISDVDEALERVLKRREDMRLAV